jgi:tRNA(Ile)-lysidine synthase TilS/MesJ
VTKETLKWFLNEEGQTWREDSTNQNAPLLRAQMRQKLIPEIKKLYPAVTATLIRQAFDLPKQQTVLNLGGKRP